ncbi:MAG: NB-ARC domain-containing protein [Lachnospiraceae bacterium]|nr:NB-ARC domain-containing protein [Lachnospiraceae bacterium]
MEEKGLKEHELLSPEDGAGFGLKRELIWEWNQNVLRSRFSNTPVGFQTEKQKEEALAEWKRKQEIYRNAHEYALCFKALPDIASGEHFVGREAELEHLGRLFSEKEGRKVLLYGMGGIGKTSLARQAARYMKECYDGILWLSCNMDLLHTICDDTQISIANLAWHAGRYRNHTEYFWKKWDVLCSLVKEKKVLLILDDMNNLRDRKLPLLWKLPCDVLVTSRNCRAEWMREQKGGQEVTAVFVEPLREERDWEAFYRSYSPVPLSREQTGKLGGVPEAGSWEYLADASGSLQSGFVRYSRRRTGGAGGLLSSDKCSECIGYPASAVSVADTGGRN